MDASMQMDATIKELLQCPMCLELFKPPIRLCSVGHSMCNNCRPQINACPCGRGDLITTRNYTLENIVQNNMTIFNILKALQCPVCNKLFNPPIRLCNFGHSMCNNCTPNTNVCPVCRSQMTEMSNYIVEDTIQKVADLYRYKDLGSKELRPLKQSNKAKHECNNAPERKPYECMFCKNKIATEDFFGHLSNSGYCQHLTIFVKPLCPRSDQQNINIKCMDTIINGYNYYLLKHMDFVYNINGGIDGNFIIRSVEVDFKRYIWVGKISCRKSAQMYTATLEVKFKSVVVKLHTGEVYCMHAREEDILLTGRCLFMSKFLVEGINTERNKFTLTITIEKT